MHKKPVSIFLFLLPFIVSAQTRRADFFSATLALGYTGAAVTNSGTVSLPPSASEAMRFNYGIHAWYNKELGAKWDFQVGLGYLDAGFRRQQKNLGLGDPTYPGIGEGMILDNSNQRKDINYDYRFHYIQVPVQFNLRVGRSKDFRSDYMLCGGISTSVLVKHHMTARLENFTVDEKSVFQLDSTGLDARVLAASISLGGRLEHKLDKKFTLIVQPVLSYFPVSITGGSIAVRPYMFTVHAGLVIDLFSKAE